MKDVRTTPVTSIWGGPLTFGLAVAIVVLTLDLIHLADLRTARLTRMDAIAREVAASIQSPAEVTPARIQEWNRITGSIIRIRTADRTMSADGPLAGAGGNMGVSSSQFPQIKVEASLPSISTRRSRWFIWDALLIGGTLTIVMGMVDRRRRRDLIKMKREIRLLVDPGPARGPRVSMPASRSLQEIARPLNDLIARWSTEISNQRHRASRQDRAIDSMAAGVISINADGSIDSLNPAARRIFEITTPQPLGMALSEAVQEPDVHDLVALATGELSSQRRTFVAARSPGDQDRTLAISVAPIMADQREGDPPRMAGAVILAEDATDLRLLERSRSDFVGNVSHELRTPLTNLLGYLSTVRDMNQDEEETRARFLETAERSAVRLASIIEDLLELAKLEAPGHSLDQECILLRPLLDSIAARHQSDLPDGRKRIHVDCDAGVKIMGSASLLDQAVDNLATNAMRYGDQDREIHISATAESSLTTIAVQDEGSGIAPRHLPRLFERFYRVDTARSRASGGTGLGLAIVKHIAVAHGGRVRVESEVGVGTRFLIDLPHAPSQPSESAAPG